MSKKHKKSRNQDTTSIIILVTAIISLIDKIIELIEKLIN